MEVVCILSFLRIIRLMCWCANMKGKDLWFGSVFFLVFVYSFVFFCLVVYICFSCFFFVVDYVFVSKRGWDGIGEVVVYQLCFCFVFLFCRWLHLRGIGEVAVYQRTTRPSLRTFPCHLQHPVAITTTLSSVCLPNKSCKKQKNGIHTLAERKVILTSTNCSRKVCEIESGSWQR